MNPRPTLSDIIADPALNGLYRLSEHVDLPEATLAYIDGIRLTSKDGMFAAFAEALAFPDYFGHNWDALEECLHDATLPAGLCIDRAGIPESADPESWGILLDILAASAEDWQAVGQPFSIFLRGGHAAYPLIVA
jgi:RNAse (barnase) inhibitor barstar